MASCLRWRIAGKSAAEMRKMPAPLASKTGPHTRFEKSVLMAAALVLLAAGAFAALPGDSTEGKRLHDANCTGCHDSGIYTRKTRSVQSMDALKQQLDSCGHATGKELTPAQKQSLIKYLNEQFYQFR
jgi:mono/diheme cytochrome c family protein